MKEQDKTPEELRKVEISNLPNEEFKVMIIKMFNELWRRMDEQNGNFNKEIENIKKKTELKIIITKIKNLLEGISSRLDGIEEQING